MKTRILGRFVALLLLASTVGLQAQDAHFSQYFASPMYTNPALTGQINGNVRLNALYRRQWNPFTKGNFTTSSFSGDAKLKQFGLGVTVVDQNSGPNNLNALTFVLSGSYDISAKSNSNQHFVVGVQAGIYNKSFSNKNVTLPDDYDPGFGVTNPGGSEDLGNLSQISPDVNFGFMWFNGNSAKRYTPFAGVAVFHLLQPYDSFDKSQRLGIRYLAHGGLRYRTSSSLDITPHFKAEVQSTAYNVIVGCNASYSLIDTETSIEGGLAYRINDAIVPYVGATYKDLSFGLSYDGNTSKLSQVGNNKNSIEVSVTYINRTNKLQKKFICPRL